MERVKWVCVLLLLGVFGCGKNEPVGADTEKQPVSNSANPAGAGMASPPVQKPVLATAGIPAAAEKLKGNWRRPDGGYLITITSLAPNGLVTAEYHNPNPIHVARASWTAMNDDAVGLFIELRDRNYDGATYRLVYQGDTDRLVGVYFQPALQQEFNIFFERVKH